MCDSAQMEEVSDTERVRILRYTLAPGAQTGWHTHLTDYVIVPYADCRVRVETRGATIEAEMRKDKPYFREKGVEHNVTSVSAETFSFLEIEVK